LTTEKVPFERGEGSRRGMGLRYMRHGKQDDEFGNTPFKKTRKKKEINDVNSTRGPRKDSFP